MGRKFFFYFSFYFFSIFLFCTFFFLFLFVHIYFFQVKRICQLVYSYEEEQGHAKFHAFIKILFHKRFCNDFLINLYFNHLYFNTAFILQQISRSCRSEFQTCMLGEDNRSIYNVWRVPIRTRVGSFLETGPLLQFFGRLRATD